MSHGTWAGYQRGCRLDCCTSAARNYQKGRVVDAYRGKPRMVPSLGARRRVEALACLGWSGYDVAIRLGHGREWTRQVLMRDRIHRRTAERIAAIYEELSMTMPPTDTHARRAMVSRTRHRAERKGWFPPLAWDDIDDPDERPTIDHRVTQYRANELAAEWAFLERAGVSIHTAASQLGVTAGAIEKAIERSKRLVA